MKFLSAEIGLTMSTYLVLLSTSVSTMMLISTNSWYSNMAQVDSPSRAKTSSVLVTELLMWSAQTLPTSPES